MAAWCAWTMGPSRSRAERSRVPWRCVRALRSPVACRKCSCLTLHVAHDAACHAVWVWRFEQGVYGMRDATCCNMLYVARWIMRILSVHRRMLHVAPARVASVRVACCIDARCALHQFALRVAPVRVACCIGVRHRCAAFPQLRRAMRSMVNGRRVVCVALVRCSTGRRAGCAGAERRCDALVRRAMEAAACSPWSRAPRCLTPWRYPTPQQGCVHVWCVYSHFFLSI